MNTHTNAQYRMKKQIYKETNFKLETNWNNIMEEQRDGGRKERDKEKRKR